MRLLFWANVVTISIHQPQLISFSENDPFICINVSITTLTWDEKLIITDKSCLYRDCHTPEQASYTHFHFHFYLQREVFYNNYSIAVLKLEPLVFYHYLYLCGWESSIPLSTHFRPSYIAFGLTEYVPYFIIILATSRLTFFFSATIRVCLPCPSVLSEFAWNLV